MKKLIALLMVCGFAFAFVACGGEKKEAENTEATETPAVTPADTTATDTTATDTTSQQ
jgi:hypothetical protein